MNDPSTDIREIRKFGLIAFLFFGCLCALGFWRGKPLPMVLFGGLSILGIGFVSLPGQLTPVYLGWLRVAHFIGRGITAVILALMYYLVITPAALLKRLFGGRPLPTRPDKTASTYWMDRDEPAQPLERFTKRY